VSVCSLMYPDCKAHAPYYIVICALYIILPHYLINSTISGKVIEHKMYILIFLYRFCLQKFLVVKVTF